MSNHKNLINALSFVLTEQTHVVDIKPLSGGDINDVFKVKTSNSEYCIKQNNVRRYPQMLTKESNGLQELSKSSFRIPEVIGTYEDENHQYLVLEFIKSVTKAANFWEIFAVKLSELHQLSKDEFGFEEDNYIGSLPQSNKQHTNWADFYTQERILPQVRMAFDRGLLDGEMLKRSEKLCIRLRDLFPIEQPSLLHGDLWSGNYMTDNSGSPVLIDPAVYYGHREMDLGMMRLFGGFDQLVFDVYANLFPLESNWQDRIPLTQLYPLLVHVNLFGGSYVNSVDDVLRKFQ